MPRYIDANALAEELSSLTMTISGLRAGKGVLSEYMKEYRKSVLRIVDEAPTIEAEPVRNGKWHQYRLSVPKGRGQTYSVYGCNKCRKHEKKRTAYCPNCGAKMDGGNDHAEE